MVAFLQLSSYEYISTEGDKTLEACIDVENISDGAFLRKKNKAIMLLFLQKAPSYMFNTILNIPLKSVCMN